MIQFAVGVLVGYVAGYAPARAAVVSLVKAGIAKLRGKTE